MLFLDLAHVNSPHVILETVRCRYAAMNERLTKELKKKALELGFADVGIAPAAPLDFAEQAIRERIKSGILRDYGIARKPPEHFTRPDNLIPGAKSVISVVWPYLTDEPTGCVAQFARCRNYHAVVGERLPMLGEWLQSTVLGAKYLVCVDTGAIIDRAAARMAGVGSYGKNALIITKAAGSWVVLGELITNVELAYDDPSPMEDCGDCTLCIEACPTGAIVAPFTIDQTRCVSHLTQMKGSIPLEMRPFMGNWIYGCDICQEVCPKNKGVRGRGPGAGTSLIPHPSSLIPYLNISEQDFDQIIGPTTIAWIGRTMFRRNVAIALGNIGDKSAVDELKKAVDDPEPIIREHAAWSLQRLKIGSEK